MDVAPAGEGPPLPRPRRQLSAPRHDPDTTSAQSKTDDDLPNSTDPDTCRICRGEATADEPLFYPCKCSGSIKYVHQDCLMEWLSHSQKKHCELCKTPFRFTKLYSPEMPAALPPHVLVNHMARYLFRNLLLWLRALLVASVWLVCLPDVMRSVWTFLFWISDEGLGSGSYAAFAPSNRTAGNGTDVAASLSLGGTTCPSSPLFAATTTVASVGGVMNPISLDAVPQLVKSIYGINLTLPVNRLYEDPMWGAVLRLFFASAGGPAATNDPPARSMSSGVDGSLSASVGQPNSLLGDVHFLRTLTRNAFVNRIIISVLEGQIITVLVIVCFILIILVRDYVVQQQPEINMRAGFAAADNPPQPQQEEARPRRNAIDIRAQLVDEGPQPDQGAGFLEPIRGDREGLLREDARDRNEAQPLPVVMGEWRRRQIDGADGADEEQMGQASGSEAQADDDLKETPAHGLEEASAILNLRTDSSPHHKDAPSQPWASETASGGPEGANRNDQLGLDSGTFSTFAKIFREADGDLEKITKIAEEENMEEKLDYWIRATKNLRERTKQQSREQGVAEAGPSGPHSGPSHDGQNNIHHSTSGTDRLSISHSSDQSSEWSWPGDAGSLEGNSDKGKAKEEAKTPLGRDEQGRPYEEFAFPRGGALRPRANTDGPQRSEGVSPLANNNWSFSALPQDVTVSSPPAHLEPSSAPAADTHDETASGPSSGAGDYPTPPSSTVAESGSSTGVLSQGVSRHVDASTSTEGDAPFGSDSDLEDDLQTVAVQTEGDEQHMANQPGGITDRLADFMFRDLDEVEPELVAVVEDGDFADDGPFVEVQQDEDDAALEPDGDVADALAVAGLDADALDDAEDFEGIMELIGMRGPISGLFQNAMFCAVLVKLTIFLGVFIPYNIGRIFIWTIANPMRPYRMLFSLSKFVQDIALVFGGVITSAVLYLLYAVEVMIGWKPAGLVMSSMMSSWHMSAHATRRITESFMSEFPIISASEMRNFSAISHEALLLVKGCVTAAFSAVGATVVYVLGGDYSNKSAESMEFVSNVTSLTWGKMQVLPATLADPGSWVIHLTVPTPETTSTINPEMAYWSGVDRCWAIAAGYLALSLIAALYLRRGAPFSSTQVGQDWEASIIDALHQASGVMKVILIIGIEMLVFPLYCGLLLDVALLPLFESTSLKSRVLFTMNYPLTSIFVHWFVGTGYMFHFALFVSMCRKIMRKGVLYFIRDPDDPEFHPVRDVLERNVVTQLRKILFSAFVYGALVIVCLGGVVWGLALAVPNVLPVHYSSNEPVLEFPIDLLFYNFLMPLAVRFFKPSDGLHAMYTWWFRTCARGLRITWFLFGERRIDEEGTLALAPHPPSVALPWYKRAFLELDSSNEVVPRTWHDTFEGGTAKPSSVIPSDQMEELNTRKAELVETQQLIPDGRFVRTPASDQVKIPKGRRVFLDVTELNTRQDGKPDTGDTDLYSSDQYQFVYVPPFFRARVFLFILFIWLFAAVTGVGFTIVPLVFGRRMFKLLLPEHIRTNDIYAFSIGIYILGSVAYGIFHARAIAENAKGWVSHALGAMSNRAAVRQAAGVIMRVARLAYAYTVLLVVFPLLVSVLMELYLLIPLHTYMYSAVQSLRGNGAGADHALVDADAAGDGSRHTVRVIQSWTVGLLYLRLGTRIVAMWYHGTRLATAIRAVLRRGWLEPDVAVLTRAFVLPGMLLWCLAVVAPYLGAHMLVGYGLKPAGLPDLVLYRLAYPVALMVGCAAAGLLALVNVFKGWTVRIRDEAYLIGERLHNFGAAGVQVRAVKRAWGPGGGGRL